MKKSEESIVDELLGSELLASFKANLLNYSQPGAALTRAQLETFHRIRNGLAHSEFERSELFYKIRKRFEQHALLLQQSESKTETAKSFASTAHGSQTMNSLPPKNAEFLLALFLDKEDQEAAIGCFTELYSKRVVRWGKSRARVWAWVQVGKTLVPVLKRVVLKVSGLIAAYEWLKHHLS